MVTVHTPNKTLGSRQTHLLVAGILMSSLLTACGGGGGLSAEEKAAQAAATAQAAAAQAAATAAAQAAAAQAAADHEAALATARQEISTAVATVADEAKSAQTASTLAGYAALQAGQQAASYQEVAESVAKTKAYAATAAEEAERAAAQKTLVAKLESDVVGSQDLTLVKKASQEAQQAATIAKEARIAAEQALKSTRAAADQVASEVKIAEAARRYTKLDSGGNELSPLADSWSCLKDKQTGLVWEAKTNDGGFRDKDWRYRHMHNYAGYGNTVDTKGQVLCRGLGTCDAYSYMNAVNGAGLCGRNSWRIPLKSELGSIAKINAGGIPPHIDQTFFPDIVYKPYEAAYCAMNTNSGSDAEHNYQGVDYGLPLLGGIQTQENLENSILIPLRYYGEIKDGLVNNPGNASNWICYTRMVSSY